MNTNIIAIIILFLLCFLYYTTEVSAETDCVLFDDCYNDCLLHGKIGCEETCRYLKCSENKPNKIVDALHSVRTSNPAQNFIRKIRELGIETHNPFEFKPDAHQPPKRKI